jgi:hypothetical protein
MSFGAARESKQVRRLCERCRERKARFRYRGEVRADRAHTLCFECHRAARDRRRAGMLAELPPATPLRSPFELALTERQIAHRRAMLAFARARRGA